MLCFCFLIQSQKSEKHVEWIVFKRFNFGNTFTLKGGRSRWNRATAFTIMLRVLVIIRVCFFFDFADAKQKLSMKISNITCIFPAVLKSTSTYYVQVLLDSYSTCTLRQRVKKRNRNF